MDNEPHLPHRERSPLLRVFSDDLAHRVASLIRSRPILIARLITAPPEAIHSVGAYLHLSPDARKPDATVAVIITNTHPRDLLAAALPDCHQSSTGHWPEPAIGYEVGSFTKAWDRSRAPRSVTVCWQAVLSTNIVSPSTTLSPEWTR
jgi:hypothetical protein